MVRAVEHLDGEVVERVGALVEPPELWTLRDGRGTTLRSFADREDAVRYPI